VCIDDPHCFAKRRLRIESESQIYLLNDANKYISIIVRMLKRMF